MLMLGTHYRSPLSFGPESLAEARASLGRIKNCMFNLEDMLGRLAGGDEPPAAGDRGAALMDFLKDCEREFREAMDDDFNSAAALGVVFSLVKEINTYVDAGSPAYKLVMEEALKLLRDLCGALGFFQGEAEPVKPVEEAPTREQLIELLLQVRQAARDGKHYELSDVIRRGLADLGVRIEDVRDGYRWRFER
jgi:cysteinyl-tRNA synthetase